MFLMYIFVFLSLIILLYILSIKPNKKRNTDPFLNHLYSHRGLHDNLGNNPENSLLAFERAVDQGFGIELDVQVTKDDIPVVFHDHSLSRVCNLENSLQDLTFEDLRQLKLFKTNEAIPRLKDILDLVDGRVPLIIEIKNETFNVSELPLIAKILDDYKGPYLIESFNPLVLIWYKKNRPLLLRGQLSSSFKKKNQSFLKKFKNFFLENLLTNFLTKPDFIAFNYKYKNMLSFKLCKMLYNPLTVAYTIKSEQALKDNYNDFNLFIFDSFIPKEDTKSS